MRVSRSRTNSERASESKDDTTEIKHGKNELTGSDRAQAIAKLSENHMGQEYVKSTHEKPMPTHDKAHNKSTGGQQQNLFQPKKF